MLVTLFVLVASLSVRMETLAVDFRQVNMVVVLFQMLFAAAMESTAVPMDILVMYLLEPVSKEAAV